MLPFLAGGRRRTVRAIGAEIQYKYAEQLKCATWSESWALKKKIEAEIREAIDRLAPRCALY